MDVKNEVCFKTKVRQELCCIKTQPNNILFLNATCFYELCQTSFSLSRVFFQRKYLWRSVLCMLFPENIAVLLKGKHG